MQIGGMYTIDFAKVSKIPKFEVTIKNGDIKRTIKLILLKNSEVLNLNNYTVVVAAKKIDGTDIFNDVIIIDAESGICEVEISEQMLALDMDLPCEIVLYGTDGVVASSSNFVISKMSNLRNEESIVSSSEFTVLTKALSKVNQINNKANKTDVRMKNIPIGMSDLTTEVKSAMTGGSVPVVGVNSIATENLQDKSVDNNKLKYTDKLSTCGLLFPFYHIDRHDDNNYIPDINVKSIILNAKVYNPKPNKVYKIEWIGYNSIISNVSYYGCEIYEYNSDFTEMSRIVSYTHDVNLKVPMSDIETRRYDGLNGIIIDVTFNWGYIKSPYFELEMRKDGHIIDPVNYIDISKNPLNEKFINDVEIVNRDLIFKNHKGESKKTVNIPSDNHGYLINNKNMDYPVKSKKRNNTSHLVPTDLKECLLDIKVLGAKQGKFYKLQFIGFGELINSQKWWTIEVDEFDKQTYDTSGEFGDRRLIKYNDFAHNSKKNGILTEEWKSDIDDIIIQTTIDWDYLNSKGEGQLYLRNTNIIIDESCYYNIQTPTKPFNYPMYVDVNNISKTAKIMFKYNLEYDMCLTISPKGCSLLPQIGDIYLVNNTENYVKNDFSSMIKWFSCPSDFVGPYQGLNAINNANGDKPESNDFTGGWHGYNGDQTGSRTATNIGFEVYVNNAKINSNNTLGAFNVKVIVTNRIHGSNTKKSDGNGREILNEEITYEFNQGKINIFNKITALEDLKISKYYGIQTCDNNWNNLLYVVDDPTIKIPFNPSNIQKLGGSKNDGSDVCEYNLSKNGHNLRAFIDTTYGLGRRKNVDDSGYLFHTQSYGKSYFVLINQETILSAGEIMCFKGGYEFYYKL